MALGMEETESLPMLSTGIYDATNTKVANIQYSHDGLIRHITTPAYTNTQGIAENKKELIACFAQDGTFSHSSTRQEAREQDERYLIVTTLLHHIGLDGEMRVLLQKRSQHKNIDPGKVSASAHGVAKQLFFKNKGKMHNIEYTALINSALEINEELKHGEGQKPFTISIRYEGIPALKEFLTKQQIDNENTIYLVPLGLYTDESYPLIGTNTRSRGLSVGFIKSTKRPDISIDPGELESVIRQHPSEIDSVGEITHDLQLVADDVYHHMLEQFQSHTGIDYKSKTAKKVLLKTLSKEN